MKNIKIIYIATILSVLSFLIVQCGIDDNPIAPEEAVQNYKVSITVTPPSSFRNIDTWNYWASSFTVEFETTFEEEHHDEGEEEHEEHHGDLQIGSATVEGMRLVVFADHASDMFHMAGDGHGEPGSMFEEEHAVEGDFLIQVHLYDGMSDHAPHGGTNIGYSSVLINAVDSLGVTHEIVMVPVNQGHGFRYLSNAVLPSGTYDLHVEAEAPAFSRMPGYELKWIDHAEAEFHDFTIDGVLDSGVNLGSVIAGGLKFGLRAGAVSPMAAVGTGMVPLTGQETLQFSLRLEDELILPEGENLYYSSVIIKIINTETGETFERVLKPSYGENGFHYAANMSIPDGGVKTSGEHTDVH